MNYLIFSDNTKGLQYLIDEGYGESIDLCYIDPPYNTGRTFKINNNNDKTRTIGVTQDEPIAYTDKYDTLDEYLSFLSERIRLIHQLLSPQGSFYLHCDNKHSHYIKILCDEIFTQDMFRADITRVKGNPKNFLKRNYGNIKDNILFYTKTDDYIWNRPYVPFKEWELKKKYPKHDTFGDYCTVSLHAPGEVENGVTGKEWKGLLPPKGRHWCTNPSELTEWDNKGMIEWSGNGNPRRKMYAKDSKGKLMQDVWVDYKDPPRPSYPTQKNSQLLNQIIRTSSREDSIVLDCFMGSGVTCIESYKLGRSWIGIDNSKYSLQTFQREYGVLEENLYNSKKYEFIEL